MDRRELIVLAFCVIGVRRMIGDDDKYLKSIERKVMLMTKEELRRFIRESGEYILCWFKPYTRHLGIEIPPKVCMYLRRWRRCLMSC